MFIIVHISNPFIAAFYALTAKNTIKKTACRIRQAALFAILTNFKQQIAAYLPEFIPQATTR
jgi:hypothetical protein